MPARTKAVYFRDTEEDQALLNWAQAQDADFSRYVRGLISRDMLAADPQVVTRVYNLLAPLIAELIHAVSEQTKRPAPAGLGGVFYPAMDTAPYGAAYEGRPGECALDNRFATGPPTPGCSYLSTLGGVSPLGRRLRVAPWPPTALPSGEGRRRSRSVSCAETSRRRCGISRRPSSRPALQASDSRSR